MDFFTKKARIGAFRSRMAVGIVGVICACLLLFSPGVQALSDHLVIGEFIVDVSGSEGAGEFVMIYNPTCFPVDIGGWDIAYKSGTGNTWSAKATIPNGTSIAAYSYYLIGGNGVNPMPDLLDQSLGFSRFRGFVALRDRSNNFIDQVGYGNVNGNVEGRPAPVPPINQSLERKPGELDPGKGNGQFTNDNLEDFLIRVTPNPRNSSSSIEIPNGAPEPPCGEPTTCIDDGPPGNQTTERRQILSWLAYSVAYLDWQTNTDDRRGYNIGAVLVDKNDSPVFWGRNCVTSKHNYTRHAEVTTMEGYVENMGDVITTLSTHRLYTSLQTCAMCAGMATLGSVSQVIYGQQDTGFGQTLQVFNDSMPWSNVPSQYEAPTVYEQQLDEGFLTSGMQSLATWLYSGVPKAIMKCAYVRLGNYNTAVFDANSKILQQAKDMLANIETYGVAHQCKLDD